jgi:hypothetical protein
MSNNDAESVESLANRIFPEDEQAIDDNGAVLDKLESAIKRLPKSEQIHLFEVLRDSIQDDQTKTKWIMEVGCAYAVMISRHNHPPRYKVQIIMMEGRTGGLLLPINFGEISGLKSKLYGQTKKSLDSGDEIFSSELTNHTTQNHNDPVGSLPAARSLWSKKQISLRAILTISGTCGQCYFEGQAQN